MTIISGGIEKNRRNWNLAEPISAAILAAGSIGSGLLGYFGSKASARDSYKYSLMLQQHSQNFQERMSNTAHQREMADLDTAGLNPLLTATGGQGASTPTGSAGTINAPDYGASIIDAISTASQIKNINANTKLQQEQAKTEEARKNNFEADTAIKKLEKLMKSEEWKLFPKKIRAELKETYSRIQLNLNTANARMIEAIASKINADANDIDKEAKERYENWGRKYPWARNLDETITRYFGGVSGNVSKKIK